MFDSVVVREAVLSVLGESYYVRIFSSGGRNYFAMTSFGGKDAIITDGRTAEDALERHRVRLPLAIGSRMRSWDLYEEYQSVIEAQSMPRKMLF
jgi:hypothetical protein